MNIALRLVNACLLVCVMVPALAQAGGDMGENPYEIGQKLLAGKHYKTARAYFEKALKRGDGRAHYGMGLVYEASGKDGDALSHYRQLIDLDPPDAQRSDAMERVAAIEERLKRKPDVTAGLLSRGKSLFKSGNYREAEQVLLKAAAADESKPEVHFYLGEVYLKLEEYTKAKAEYTKAKRYY